MLTEKETEIIERMAMHLDISVQEMTDYFQRIKIVIVDTWETLKDFIKEVSNIQKQLDEERKVRHSWDVPRNTTKHHQVMNRKPLFIHARSNL